MSSLYVRNLVETWIAAIGTIPFHQTINQIPDNPQDNIWLTVDFNPAGATKETFCEEFAEDGEITLIFMGRVGIGFNTLFAAAEQFADAFWNSSDPTGKLNLIIREPPFDYAGQDNPWFVVEISFQYQLRN